MKTYLFIFLVFILQLGCTPSAAPPPTPFPKLPTLPPVPTAPQPPTQAPTSTNQATGPQSTQPTAAHTTTPSPTDLPSEASTLPAPQACQIPAGWVAYTVQTGDTLFSLANRTGTTVAAVQDANCLNDTLIFAGQTLYLPTIPQLPTNPPPPPTPSATVTATSTAESPEAPGPSDPIIVITPTSGPPGTVFVLGLEKFPANDSVTVQIDINFALVFETTLMVDGNGAATVTFNSQPDAAPGQYSVSANGATKSASGEFTIVAPPPNPTSTVEQLPPVTPSPPPDSTVEATVVPDP